MAASRPLGRFDMMKVLVAYASRHGATRGIAQRIADVLRTEGLEVDVAPVDHAAGVGAADAVVIGSAVYMGTWLKEAVEFVKQAITRTDRVMAYLETRPEHRLAKPYAV
jgi:menaquinone-dependent protoporphyrinogen IX oxidase